MRVEVSVPEWLIYPGLVLLGVGVGAYGTLIGAGGGFLLVPALILLYPEWEPDTLTSVSLAVVFMTALSASSAYARQRRIDYKAGALFATATVPGAITSAILVTRIKSDAFEIAFAILLLAVAVWLLVPRPSRVLVTPAPARYGGC